MIGPNIGMKPNIPCPKSEFGIARPGSRKGLDIVYRSLKKRCKATPVAILGFSQGFKDVATRAFFDIGTWG